MRRILLTQAVARWQGDDKRHVERHIPRILDALYREMIEFEPVGLVTQVHLMRFMRHYHNEIQCLFAKPFNLIKTPEQEAAQRAEVRAYITWLLEMGTVPRREDEPERYEQALKIVIAVRLAETAYQQAHTHVWSLDGGTGTPPTAPGSDWSLMSQDEQALVKRVRATWATRAARYREATATAAAALAAQAAAGPQRAAPPSEPTATADDAEERSTLQALEYGSPEDVPLPDADRIDWPGKQHHESPRDMMRPYLEKIGRLDLLEHYSDEIVQYGERVEYKIDGKWR